MKALFLAAVLLLAPSVAQAAFLRMTATIYCGPHKEVDAALFKFKRVAEGTAGEKGDHGTGEVWVNPNTMEWAVVQRAPDGVACFLIGGNNFHPATTPGQGA